VEVTLPPAIAGALAFIRSPGDEAAFRAAALEVFAHQYAADAPYRRLCDRRGATPAAVTRWEDVPSVPTAAFQHAVLTTAPAARVFRTSGTTAGTQGEHHLPDTGLYDAAWAEPFRAHVMPDRHRMPVVSLLPAEEDFPDSSLAYMGDRIGERFGMGVDRFLGRSGMDAAGAEARLRRAEAEGDAVLLLATAFSAVHLLDHLAGAPALRLPEGSRIMDTGGFKGRSRTLSREGLLAVYRDRLGVPPDHVVGEYGMTELSSQFYERHLADAALGKGAGDRSHAGAPWTRVRVMDPGSLAPVAAGGTGLIAVFDLANAWTVSAVLTGDLGRVTPGGFEVLGRAEGAALRGCSLLTEEILEQT